MAVQNKGTEPIVSVVSYSVTFLQRQYRLDPVLGQSDRGGTIRRMRIGQEKCPVYQLNPNFDHGCKA